MNVFDASSAAQATFGSSLVRHPDHLEVRYRIENTGKEEIAVLDQLGTRGIGEEYEYSPHHVYVELDGEVVHLVKGALSVPPGASPREPPYGRPDARVVAPGESIEETFVVPVPVKVRNPYRRDMPPGPRFATKRAVARAVVVAVGIVPRSGATFFERSHPAHPHAVSVIRLPLEPVERWQTMASKRFDLDEDLAVLDYETLPRP